MKKKYLLTIFLVSSFLFANDTHLFKRYSEIMNNSPNTKSYLDDFELYRLFSKVKNHPVTSLLNIDKYDPQGVIGFCFGRALAVSIFEREKWG